MPLYGLLSLLTILIVAALSVILMKRFERKAKMEYENYVRMFLVRSHLKMVWEDLSMLWDEHYRGKK